MPIMMGGLQLMMLVILASRNACSVARLSLHESVNRILEKMESLDKHRRVRARIARFARLGLLCQRSAESERKSNNGTKTHRGQTERG